MTENARATLSGALGCLGALLIGYGTGSLVAMIGAFCVVVGYLLPWYSVYPVPSPTVTVDVYVETDDEPEKRDQSEV